MMIFTFKEVMSLNPLKPISDILSQFTQAQRIFVLIITLGFTSGTYLISNYLSNDDCRTIIEENLKLHQDFLTISRMIRERELKALKNETEMMVSTSPFEESTESIVLDTATVSESTDEIVGKILEISDKNVISN
jgi:hypothetical protein